MNRRRFLGLSLGLGGLVAGVRGVPSTLQRVEGRSRALGAEASIVVFHEDRSVAEGAVTAAWRALDDLENVLSLYRPESEICRLNRDGFRESPHPDLTAVLGCALEWARRTDGAFDPTVQPLWSLYAAGKGAEVAEVARTLQRVDWRRVEIGEHSIRLGSGQAITLNGIAQGFAADRVHAVLLAHGIRHALVNTGELGGFGRKTGGEPWRIGIQHPRKPDSYLTLAALENRFLATSGDYETRFADDFSSHHIFDPSTGRSPTSLASVSVTAPTGMEADALSTAMFVLGPGPALEVAATRLGVDALLVLENGEVLRTPNFPEVA